MVPDWVFTNSAARKLLPHFPGTPAEEFLWHTGEGCWVCDSCVFYTMGWGGGQCLHRPGPPLPHQAACGSVQMDF